MVVVILYTYLSFGKDKVYILVKSTLWVIVELELILYFLYPVSTVSKLENSCR